MFLKSISKQVFFMVFTLVLTFNLAHAAWWGQDNLPVPVNTQQVKQEKRLLMGSEYEFVYYESSQGPDEIRDFYRKRLVNLGWKEKSLVGDIAAAQGISMDSYVNQAISQNLIFEKKDENIILTMMSEAFSQDGKTRFSIARGKIESSEEAEESSGSSIALLTSPKKEIAPIYPGADLFSLSEGSDFQKATYVTSDNIERVAFFFKSQMPEYGWFLKGEAHPEKIIDEVVTAEDMLKACPNCSKETLKNGQAVETWGAQLFFANQKGYICNIDLSEVIMPEETKGISENITTIIIDYEEKK